MRRLAPLLLLALAALGHARPESAAYLKLRAERKIVQPSSPAALKEVKGPKVLELTGRVIGTFEAGGTAIFNLEMPNGEPQIIEASPIPAWFDTHEGPVRVIVRAQPEGDTIKVTLLAAAPEIDVLPAEEAYWRKQAERQRLAQKVAKKTSPVRTGRATGTLASRGAIYGRIGGRSYVSRPAGGVLPLYAAFIQGQNPRLGADKAQSIASDVIRFSNGYGVDARLVLAILMVESGFDPNAVSRSGAQGLGQLMPGTARWMGVRNSFDTTENLYGMIKLLNTLSRQFNRAPQDPIVLAAYNAGDGAVRRHGGVPPYRETQNYVVRVSQYFRALTGS